MLNIHDEQKIRTPASALQKEERKQAPPSTSLATAGQRWSERLLGVVKRYPIPLVAVTLMLASLVFWLAGRGDIANWTLLAAVLLGGVPLLWETLQQVVHREFGVDVIAILAIGGSILLQQYLAGALVVLMLSGGEALEAYALRRARAPPSRRLPRGPRAARTSGRVSN